MAKLSRRAFLASGLVLALLIVVPYAAYQARYGSADRVIVAVLRRRLGFLKLPEGTFERFAREYTAYKRQHTRQLARLSVIALPFTYFTVYAMLPMGHPLRRLEDSIVTKFLLSTDFFQHGADESRDVRYLSFYMEHKAVCRNPFATPPGQRTQP